MPARGLEPRDQSLARARAAVASLTQAQRDELLAEVLEAAGRALNTIGRSRVTRLTTRAALDLHRLAWTLYHPGLLPGKGDPSQFRWLVDHPWERVSSRRLRKLLGV